jgi:hypothetical protein
MEKLIGSSDSRRLPIEITKHKQKTPGFFQAFFVTWLFGNWFSFFALTASRHAITVSKIGQILFLSLERGSL